MDSSYLAHHGVKGQKWGVRHGPPYPIEDKVMKKGEHLRTVLAAKNHPMELFLDRGRKERGERAMYTYNADNEWDNKVYKGPFSVYKVRMAGAQWLGEQEYVVVKDMKMPNRQERVDRFMKLYDNRKDKKDLIKCLQNVRQQCVQYNVGNEKEQEAYRNFDASKPPTTKKDIETAYSLFNHAMEASHFYKATKTYTKNMSKEYDAMVDDNNQGTYNRAQDPVIVFNANRVLKSYGDIRPIEPDEVEKNLADVRAELEKHGEHVKF